MGKMVAAQCPVSRRAVLGGLAVLALAPGAVTARELDWQDFEEEGMTGRRSYESPLTGIALKWNRDWILDETEDVAVIAGDPESDQPLDELYLMGAEESDPRSYANFLSEPLQDVSMQDIVDYLSTEEGLTELAGDSGVTLTLLAAAADESSAQVWTRREGKAPRVFLDHFTSTTEGFMHVILFTTIEQGEADYASIAETTLDGDPFIEGFDWEEIADAYESTSTSPARALTPMLPAGLLHGIGRQHVRGRGA